MKKEKSVVIMDEVDGMSGDKGGIQELIKQIKSANRPIICICNDRDKQAIRTLRQYCYELVFKRPSLEDIFSLLEVIITENFSERIWREIDKSVVRAIVEHCQFDIRQTINYMEMWMRVYREGQTVDYRTVRDNLFTINPFEATK